MLHFKSLTTEAFSSFRCSCELRSLWNDIGKQLALAQSAAKARRGRAAHLKRHQSPPKYGSISKFSAKYASTFLGSVLAFAPFIGYDVTSVELAIPQFISPQRAGTAATAKSVLLQSTDKYVLTFFFRFYLYRSVFPIPISWGDIRPIALHGDSRMFLKYRSKMNRLERFNAQREYSIFFYQCFPQANVQHISPGCPSARV